jgi:DNA-binding transcriptional regulator YdaS (Cro superfamily)
MDTAITESHLAAPDGAPATLASQGATPQSALKRACEVAGGQKPLARRIGTTQSRVWYWLERARHGAAAPFVLPIEAATGVSRHELRPDIYPAPAIAPSESEQEQNQEAGRGMDR